MEGVEVGMVISGGSERMRVPLVIDLRATRPLPLLGISRRAQRGSAGTLSIFGWDAALSPWE